MLPYLPTFTIHEEAHVTLRKIGLITGILFAMLVQTEAAQAQAPANRPPPEPPLPLLFEENFTLTPASVLLAQDVVGNPDLLMTIYGNPPDLSPASGTPHIWTGLCSPACGVTFKLKDSYVDLSGRAHMMWHSRTSGYHQIRPLVKLADGTLLAGDFADENPFDYRTVDFNFAQVRWLVLDPATLTTKGVFLPEVDLRKVDEAGFVDLTPGSGHGFGGYSAVGHFKVYGKAVPRE